MSRCIRRNLGFILLLVGELAHIVEPFYDVLSAAVLEYVFIFLLEVLQAICVLALKILIRIHVVTHLVAS